MKASHNVQNDGHELTYYNEVVSPNVIFVDFLCELNTRLFKRLSNFFAKKGKKLRKINTIIFTRGRAPSHSNGNLRTKATLTVFPNSDKTHEIR